jgi:TrmH family RNA methyltransferase
MPAITSNSNERLKRLRRLRKRRDRDAEGVFLVEGYRQVRRAVDNGVEIEALFACPELYQGEDEADLADHLAAAGLTTPVAPEPFLSVTTRDRPDGLLAVARQPDTSLGRIADTGLLLVAEGVERPGNLGTMLRAAAGAGVTGVIVADPQTDVFAPEVVRASVGTLFTVPLARASTADAISFLRDTGTAVVTASPDGAAAYWDADLAGPTAIVVGSEQHGVTRQWLDQADTVVRIPMAGVDSLNVAAAAAVLLFEAVRQRR